MAGTGNTALLRDEKVGKAVLTLAAPTVAASLVAIVYSLSDTLFVGLLNDPVQTAAVTLCSTVLLAFNAVTNLFGVGASSMMSRALGRGDMKTLRQSSAFGFWCTLFFGALYSVGCWLGMTPLLNLLGADSTTWNATREYMTWAVVAGAVPSMLNMLMAYLVRSEGATLHASIGTMSGCLLNIVLDPIFILPWGLNMGAEGAALATFLSNCAACLYFAGYMVIRREKTCVCLSPREFTLRREVVGGVLNVGIPASIQNLLNVTSHTLLNNMAAPFGAEALAAMGIASKVCSVPFYVSNGLSQGAMPLIGFAYAAGLKDRMKQAVVFTAKLVVITLTALAVFLFLLAGPVVRLFIEDSATVAYGAEFMKGLSVSVPLLGVDFLAVGVFQALGKGNRTLFMAFIRKIVLEIPALLLLNRLVPLYGLAWSQTVAETGMAAVGTWLLVQMMRRLDRQPQPAAEQAGE